MVTTISAYGGGCKNPADDPNSDLKGYTDAMGPFCRNKRAGAAFFWFNFREFHVLYLRQTSSFADSDSPKPVAWLTTALFVLLKWQSIRKNPTTTGFTIPGAQFPQDDEEAFAHHTDTEIADDPDRVYRPSGDYYATEGERGLFGETSQGYGGNDGEEESYHNTPAVDPFADQGRREFEGNYEDSYDTIRKVRLLSNQRVSWHARSSHASPSSTFLVYGCYTTDLSVNTKTKSHIVRGTAPIFVSFFSFSLSISNSNFRFRF